MDKLILWFILTNGSGYIEPLTLQPAEMRCGIAGAVAAGITVDRPVNPTLAMWPDPASSSTHCEVDIAQRVAALAHGEYELATTVVTKVMNFGGPADGIDRSFNGPDPHTSGKWLRSLSAPGLPPRPTNFRIGVTP